MKKIFSLLIDIVSLVILLFFFAIGFLFLGVAIGAIDPSSQDLFSNFIRSVI